jgi:hypothetical protein
VITRSLAINVDELANTSRYARSRYHEGKGKS